MVLARGSRLMDIHGVGPVVAARILAGVGDIARFPNRNRSASWTGTAPLDASSGPLTSVQRLSAAVQAWARRTSNSSVQPSMAVQ